MKNKVFFFLFSIVTAFVLHTNHAYSEDVVIVGFKAGKSPFVIPTKPFKDSDFDPAQKLGIEVEIVREIFALSGKIIKPVYMNYKRMESELTSGQIQMGSNLQTGVSGVFYADNHVRLFDHYIYPQGGQNEIKTFDDLEGKRVLSFQNATKFLSDEYRAAIKKTRSYREIDDQEKQVKALISDRADVVLMDISIFKYFAKRHKKSEQKFSFSPMFPKPFYYSSGFTTKELRDEFAGGLQKLKDSGKYDEIYRSYIE